MFVFICCISCHFLTIYAVAHLSRIYLRVTDQTQQTGPNEFALHFEVVFCSLLTTNWKVNASLSLNSFLIVFSNCTTVRHKFVKLKTLKQIFELESIPSVFLYDILKKTVGKNFVWMFQVLVFVWICCISCHF